VDDRQRLIMDHRSIARRYVSGWFWVDLVASVPWSLIADSLEEDTFSAVGLVLVSRRLNLLGRVVGQGSGAGGREGEGPAVFGGGAGAGEPSPRMLARAVWGLCCMLHCPVAWA
jgi:hypothetical protein